MFAMLRQPPTRSTCTLTQWQYPHNGHDRVELLANYDIRIPEWYTQKLTKTPVDYSTSRHPQAVTHIDASEYLDPGQSCVRDQPVTVDDRATVRPAEPKWRPSNRGNANRWNDKGRGKEKASDSAHPERERDRYRRWESGTVAGNVIAHGDPLPECLHHALLSQLCDTGIFAVILITLPFSSTTL